MARVRSMQLLDSSSIGRNAATSSPLIASSTPHSRSAHSNNGDIHSHLSAQSSFRANQNAGAVTVSVMPVPFPSLDSKEPAVTSADGAQSANSSHANHRQPAGPSHTQRPAGVGSTGTTAAIRAPLPPSSPSMSSSSSQRSGQHTDAVANSGATLTLPTLSTFPHSPQSHSASPAALKSPTSFLSTFFSSAAASLTTKTEAQQPHSATATVHTPHNQVSGTQLTEQNYTCNSSNY